MMNIEIKLLFTYKHSSTLTLWSTETLRVMQQTFMFMLDAIHRFDTTGFYVND